MSAFGVIQLHDDITRSNGLYCCICFRTSLERRLVDPVNLKIFLNSTVGDKPFKHLQVCYFCEALAASAVRFLKAVKFASVVGELYEDISKSKQLQEVIRVLIDAQAKCVSKSNGNFNLVYKESAAAVTTNPILTRAVDIDKRLRAMNRFELSRTDILVVSSLKAKPEQRPPLRTDTVVVTDAPQAPSPRRIAGTASVMPEHMVMSVLDDKTNNMILHPLVKGLDGNVYVPSLNLQIVGKDQFKSVPDVHIKKYIPMPPIPLTNNTVLHSHSNNTPTNRNPVYNHPNPVYNPINPNKTATFTNTIQLSKYTETPNSNDEYQNFLIGQMREKLNSTKKRKVERDPLEISVGDVQSLLSENAQGSGEVKLEFIDDDEVEVVNALRPVLKTDRTVDWEDKIPMDVISFMDATDPNPRERIMQPPAPPAPPAARGGADIECIDLC